jgi:hypothetical protein
MGPPYLIGGFPLVSKGKITMQYTVSIDWLRMTVPDQQAKYDFIEAFAGKHDPMEHERPIPRYSSMRNYEHCRVDWHVVKPELRVVITMTGEHLRTFAAHGGDIRQVFEWTLQQADVNVTRVDGAIDLFDSAADIPTFFNAFIGGEMNTHTTSGHLIRSGGSGHEAHTAYIGSRESARMLRVYDKGKQTNAGGDWIRCEIEIKKPMAFQFIRQAYEWGVVAATIRAMHDFIPRTGFGWFDDLRGDNDELVDMSVGRKNTNHDRWLFDTALPAVIKRVSTGDPLIIASLLRAINAARGATET